MFYYQLQLSNFTTDPDRLSDQLIALGAMAVTLEDAADQPIFEPTPNTAPLWQQTKLTALFSEAKIRQGALAKLLQETPILRYQLETIAEQNWQRICMAQFQPLKFGKRTWICPSWCTPPEPEAVSILLDPGLAFGTGTHPTTALCLEWLDSAALQDKIVMDYGCGSGILAITALLHGAKHVYAIDYDPQALQATRDNAQRNGIDQKRLSILAPEAIPISLKVNILIANILAEPLIKLAPRFFHYLHVKGQVILSGILLAQGASIMSAYEINFVKLTSLEKDGWLRLTAWRG